MKLLHLSRLVVVLSLVTAIPWISLSLAGDPVDLRDKKGVVDPRDLKKHDPPPPKVMKEEPPPPSVPKERDVPPFEVKKSHEARPGNK